MPDPPCTSTQELPSSQRGGINVPCTPLVFVREESSTFTSSFPFLPQPCFRRAVRSSLRLCFGRLAKMAPSVLHHVVRHSLALLLPVALLCTRSRSSSSLLKMAYQDSTYMRPPQCSRAFILPCFYCKCHPRI